MSGPLLRIEGLSKRFGGLLAVDGLHLDVQEGETLGLIGPNGSGKTTVLNLLTGAYRSDSGRVLLRGVDVTREPSHRVCRAGIARTFQLVRPLRGMTVAENVLVGCVFGRDRPTLMEARRHVSALLEQVGLEAQAQLPVDMLTYIDQKRVELARALAANPSLLLLDEWLAGLNPSELNVGIDLLRSLRESGIAIILIEHVLHAVRSLCDRCVVLNAGQKIAEGNTDTVLTDPEVLRAYLGSDDA